MPRLAILLPLVLAACLCALASGCTADGANDARYSMTASADNSLTAGAGEAAPMDPRRSIAERDCGQPIDPSAGGNLRCK